MFKSQTWLVAKNTYRQRVKGIGYWAMVLSPFLIAAVYLVIGLIVSSGVNQTTNVAVVNNSALTQVLKADKNLDTHFSDVTTLKEAQKKLENEQIDGYIEQSQTGGYSLTTSNQSSSKFSQTNFQQVFTSIHLQETARSLKLSPQDLQRLLSPAPFAMKTWTASGSNTGGDARFGANMGVASVTSILIFVLLMMYVGLIGQEIGNEKSNRIMETLLAATSSNVQYYGKIIGIILLTLTQLGLYAIGFSIAYPFIKNIDAVKMVKSLLSGIDLSFGIYLFFMTFIGILGYLFVASIIASLVNEQAQIQQATQPIAFFSMIGYIGGFAGAAVPGNIILRILSFVPFISPTLMSSRFATQYSSSSEAYIALAIQALATVAVAKAGEKIYARNVLSYSDERIIRQLFRNLRGENGGRLQTQARSESENRSKKQGVFSLNHRLSLRTRLIIAALIIIVGLIYHFLIQK